MGKLRTSEELQRYFQQEKEKRQRQQYQARERKKRIKAQEALLRKQHLQHLARLEKQALEGLKQPTDTFHIIHTNRIGHSLVDDDLYETWDEILEAEKRGEGKINWQELPRLIDDTKQQLGIQ